MAVQAPQAALSPQAKAKIQGVRAPALTPFSSASANWLEIAHKSIQRIYLLQNWVEAQSYWVVLFAKTAKTIGLLPEKRDTGNLRKLGIDIVSKAG
jgi:hypothetical protein